MSYRILSRIEDPTEDVDFPQLIIEITLNEIPISIKKLSVDLNYDAKASFGENSYLYNDNELTNFINDVTSSVTDVQSMFTFDQSHDTVDMLAYCNNTLIITMSYGKNSLSIFFDISSNKAIIISDLKVLRTNILKIIDRCLELHESMNEEMDDSSVEIE